MTKPDTKNAYIRGQGSKRTSPDVVSEEAQRLLNDPAFERGFSMVRDGCVHLLESLQHDGSPEMDAYEREITRTLRTLSRLKRLLALTVQGQQLRLADFKPVDKKED